MSEVRSSLRPAITGVVLAGGMGSRMGGVDKGLQPFAGRPLVAHVIERLAPQVDTLLINANRNPAVYAAFGYPVVADAIAGFAGPLAGLHAALAAAATPLVATAPCDSPRLPVDLVCRLLAELTANDAQIAVARTGDQPHPVFCLCRRELLDDLTAYLQAGERKFERWYQPLAAVDVDFSDVADAFANINTIEELQRLGG
ncbi:MAG: molybdenum cofactor guanylyltransferase MobA [Azonexaceae bacterium]|nr:molybdenum cofactor guanylyltransferase MobA [Azonexaceae bacterium]